MSYGQSVYYGLHGESSGWLFKLQLAGGGGMLWLPHCRPHGNQRVELENAGAVKYVKMLSEGAVSPESLIYYRNHNLLYNGVRMSCR